MVGAKPKYYLATKIDISGMPKPKSENGTKESAASEHAMIMTIAHNVDKANQ